MNAGDILIEYHPHSGKVTRILSPEEFKESLGDRSEPTDQPDDEPWRPFRSREDFEFADFVHDAALNRTQIEWLMKFVQHCQDTPGSFTLRNYNDLKSLLEDASKLLTPVSTLPYVLYYQLTSRHLILSSHATRLNVSLRVKKNHTTPGAVLCGTG